MKHRNWTLLILAAGLLIAAPAAQAQVDETFVFFGFVFEDPWCDHNTGIGLPDVLVTLFNDDMSILGQMMTLGDPPELLGYFHIAGIVAGNHYYYRFEKPDYLTVEGDFTATNHDYKLRPCMVEAPVPVEPSTWGLIKAIYTH